MLRLGSNALLPLMNLSVVETDISPMAGKDSPVLDVACERSKVIIDP